MKRPGPLLAATGLVTRAALAITRRIWPRHELREQERYYRALLEHSEDIIVLLDPDGTIRQDRHPLPTNTLLLGYGPDENYGKNALDLVHPDDRHRLVRVLRNLLENPGRALVDEFRILHKNGAWVHADATAINLLSLPEVGAIVVHYRDITGRKMAEEMLRRKEDELRQSQKLEAIGRLAGGVAHDFNNLLTVIKGYSRLLLKTADRNDPRRTDMEEISKAADRATELTRQLLAFSRGQIIEPRTIDLNQVVREMRQMLVSLAGESIETVIRLAPVASGPRLAPASLAPVASGPRLAPASLAPAPCLIRADASQITRVVMNLALNARDAMPDGGRLTVTVGNVILDDAFIRNHPAAQPGPHAELVVSDTGTGMTADVLSHIFEPFFTTKEPGRGTGLGLATVYGIIKQSGGYIWADSSPGRGTEFHVYLPCAQDTLEPVPGAVVAPDPEGGGETVLLVEDEDMVRKLTRTVLSSAGYNVLEARNGNEAFELAAGNRGRIHVLLTDIVMPGLNGFDLAVKLTPDRPDMRVLYMSGYADRARVTETALKLGHGFLAKPFSDEELLAHIRKVLNGAS
jgi:PAS domain S-box-containing protein